MTQMRTCPKCGSGESFRSRRKHIEYLLLYLRPYRCRECNQRFFARVRRKEQQAQKTTA